MLNLYEGKERGTNDKSYFTVASISRVSVSPSSEGYYTVYFNDGEWGYVDETTRNQILKEMRIQG